MTVVYNVTNFILSCSLLLFSFVLLPPFAIVKDLTIEASEDSTAKEFKPLIEQGETHN